MDKIIDQITPEKKSLPLAAIAAASKESFSIKVFDPVVVSFFHELSKHILADPILNRIPATAALGFWLRKGHLSRLIEENGHLNSTAKVHCSPVGIVFHICPSNVDTMFLYSLAISLLAGNKNILRISQRFSDPAIEQIFMMINDLLAKEEYMSLKDYICIVSYGHDAEVNTYFSKIADVRIIWGGDATIKTFKAFETGPRTRDIAFADRISGSVFGTSKFNSATEEVKREVVRKFYNDSFTFDQKGCSSPQIIFLLGNKDDNKQFEDSFYNLLSDFAEKSYNNDISSIASMKMNKLVEDALTNDFIGAAHRSNNYLYLLDIREDNKTLLHSCGAGYFYMQQLPELGLLKDIITKKIQTISYFGLSKEEILALTDFSSGLGIDRIVPVGSALDFEYIWDGYNLLDELTTKKWIIYND